MPKTGGRCNKPNEIANTKFCTQKSVPLAKVERTKLARLIEKRTEESSRRLRKALDLEKTPQLYGEGGNCLTWGLA